MTIFFKHKTPAISIHSNLILAEIYRNCNAKLKYHNVKAEVLPPVHAYAPPPPKSSLWARPLDALPPQHDATFGLIGGIPIGDKRHTQKCRHHHMW